MNYKAIETRKSELMRNFREVCAAGNRLLCLISRGLAMKQRAGRESRQGKLRFCG